MKTSSSPCLELIITSELVKLEAHWQNTEAQV